MRKTRSIIPSFAFYDRTGIQRYLEKQAARGWLLESAGNYLWRFRRTDPRTLTFAVVYFPQADAYDPAPSEAEETFREFCAHGGWTLAGANAQMQIFYSDRENPTPIETDPVMEVENIHKSMKKSALPAYWMLEFSCVFQLIVQWMALQNGLIRYLSNGVSLYLAATWCVLSVIALSRHLSYALWRRRARTAAERDNVFLETKSTVWAENLAAAMILLGFLGLILTMEDRQMALVMGLSIAMMFAVMALTELLRRRLKKDGYKAASNKKATLITSVVLTFIGMLAVVPMVSRSVMDKWPEDSRDSLTLNIWELLGEEEQNYGTLLLTDQESAFLGYQRIYQYTNGNVRDQTLEYNLVDVKASFLYKRCLEEMMIVPERMQEGKYVTVDPTPWGADEAWQLHDGDKFREWYVLCYEASILEIVPDWELTEAQKKQVGEMIG